MMGILDATFFHNSVRTWALVVAAILLSYLVLHAVLKQLRNRLATFAERTKTDWDNLFVESLSKTKSLFLLFLAIYIGSSFLELPARIRSAIDAAAVLALLVQGGIWLTTGFTFWLTAYTKRELDQDRAAATTMSALAFVVKLALWTVLLLVALDNLGVNISTLIAGLGVGGVAVALATQNILGDLFASLSIVLDKPFVLGDFLIVDDLLGSVEHIGLKTTRIRSLWGEQVVFSNGDLLKSRLRNFGRMYERRIVFAIGVTYQTPREQLARIPGIIRDAITAQEKTRFDRSHFKEYGDFSINFESVYYVLVPDYNTYMDVQQAINLAIHERFEAEGIEFAYPTQTLFVVRQGGGPDEESAKGE